MYMIFGNFFRYIVTLHQAWLVNSAAHISGYQIYDKSLQPRENTLVTYLAMGEGYHNYHHTYVFGWTKGALSFGLVITIISFHSFPWDYSASEHGWKDNFNWATAFIDMFAAVGLVWDRRVVSKQVIEARISRTGDSSIMPPSLNAQRKPASALWDIGLGLVVTSWSLWFTWIIRFLVAP